MSKKEPLHKEARAREMLRGDRQRIEGWLADLEQHLTGELDEIDTDTDLRDDRGGAGR